MAVTLSPSYTLVVHCFAWLTVAYVFSLTPSTAEELSKLQGKPLTYVYVVAVVVVVVEAHSLIMFGLDLSLKFSRFHWSWAINPKLLKLICVNNSCHDSENCPLKNNIFVCVALFFAFLPPLPLKQRHSFIVSFIIM